MSGFGVDKSRINIAHFLILRERIKHFIQPLLYYKEAVVVALHRLNLNFSSRKTNYLIIQLSNFDLGINI